MNETFDVSSLGEVPWARLALLFAALFASAGRAGILARRLSSRGSPAFADLRDDRLMRRFRGYRSLGKRSPRLSAAVLPVSFRHSLRALAARSVEPDRPLDLP